MTAFSPRELGVIRSWLRKRGVVRPEEYRDSFLERRVRARMDAMGLSNVDELLRAVGPQEKSRDAFLQKLLVPTTEFLRNPEVFHEVSRILAERAPAWGEPIRVLSAGCSTGEEAYGLAALLDARGLEYRILALDRSSSALRALRAGTYDPRTLGKVDKRLSERYFNHRAAGYSVAGKLRARVLPARWDLGCGLPRGPFHAVLLRNVLIYFTEEAKVRLLSEARAALAPGGLLVLGKAESAGRAAPAEIVARDRERRIYERRVAGRPEPPAGREP